MCPYKGCEKELSKPTVITDSAMIPRETYYICPHCMRKIEIIAKETKVIGIKATENLEVLDPSAKRARINALLEEPNIVEITSDKKSNITSSNYEPFFRGLGEKSREKPKECDTSEFHCAYHFGYLSEKNKNETVPETCFGCPKSLECMLSEFNKSQESLEEIKKWYSFKL